MNGKTPAGRLRVMMLLVSGPNDYQERRAGERERERERDNN